MFEGKIRIKLYGAGDNSVTDRMYYEKALEICSAVARLPNVYDQNAVVATVEPLIPVVISDKRKRLLISASIAATLDSNGGSRTSRIAVESVRYVLQRDLT